MRERVVTWGLALVFGILGMGLVQLAQVAYRDHLTIQALVQTELQRQQAQPRPVPAEPTK